MTWSLRSAADVCTVGATPCAENTTIAPSGTSSVSSTNTAPASASVSTTCRLCTISWRTYTGAPCFSSARSTVSTARSTPAQYPRGSASRTRLPATPVDAELEAPGIPMLIVGGMVPRVLTRAAGRPAVGCGAMPTAPYGVRLLMGAAVTAIEETLKLPQTILTYPMTVVSQLAHLVMKMQQDVADLVNKGDETLESLFPPKDEQPEWATFDEDLTDDAPAARPRTANGSPRAGSRCSPAASPRR